MIHLHRSAKFSKQDLKNMRKADLIRKKERIASEIKAEENDLQYFENALNDTTRKLSEKNLLALHELIKDAKEKIKRLTNLLKKIK